MVTWRLILISASHNRHFTLPTLHCGGRNVTLRGSKLWFMSNTNVMFGRRRLPRYAACNTDTPFLARCIEFLRSNFSKLRVFKIILHSVLLFLTDYSVPSSRVTRRWDTTTLHYVNTPKRRRSHLHRGGSLRLRTTDFPWLYISVLRYVGSRAYCAITFGTAVLLIRKNVLRRLIMRGIESTDEVCHCFFLYLFLLNLVAFRISYRLQ
jgi:hypothetical protein